MQLQSDILDTKVVRPSVLETTALGAAFLAGLAVGFWSSEAELASLWQRERSFDPAASSDQVAKIKSNWEKALSRTKGWAD